MHMQDEACGCVFVEDTVILFCVIIHAEESIRFFWPNKCCHHIHLFVCLPICLSISTIIYLLQCLDCAYLLLEYKRIPRYHAAFRLSAHLVELNQKRHCLKCFSIRFISYLFIMTYFYVINKQVSCWFKANTFVLIPTNTETKDIQQYHVGID